MGVKTLGEQAVFQFGVGGVIPEVFVLPRVGLKVEQFANAFAMINRKLVLARTVHGGESAAAASEVGVERVKVFAADEGSMFAVGFAAQDGQKRFPLLIVRLRYTREVQQRGGEVKQFDQFITLYIPAKSPRPTEDEWHANETFVKPATLPHQPVITKCLTMVAGENDHGVVALAGCLERGKDARELVVDLRNHRVVARLRALGVMILGRTHLILKIAFSQQRLRSKIALAKVRPRHRGRIELLCV